MRKDDKASISLKKVISVSIILLFVMGISVMAVTSKVKSVKITLSDGYEMNVLTTKEKVSDILDENHIILLPEENAIPNFDANTSDNKTIRITKENINTVQVSENVETWDSVTVQKLLEENYNNIVEKVIIEQTTIPFETETKDLSTGNGDKKEVVKQKGIDGIKETTYKITINRSAPASSSMPSSNLSTSSQNPNTAGPLSIAFIILFMVVSLYASIIYYKKYSKI